MNKTRISIFVVALLVVAAMLAFVFKRNAAPQPDGQMPELTVGIAPYQDLAMLVNAPSLGFDAKSGIRLRLVTMAWEDILPAVASAGRTVDVGFGSYVEYLTKYARMNEGSSDPVIYVQPLYVYKGGGFIALNSEIKPFTGAELNQPAAMARLRGYRIGAQKQSLYDMMIYSVAQRAGILPAELKVVDMPMNDGLLALQSGSLDITAGGLTQVSEARKRGGGLILSMEDAGFADITGFICLRSVLEKKRPQIEALIRVWFQSVDYVYGDMKTRSTESLAYLRKNAATKYTYEEYVEALSQEYLPRSLTELHDQMLAPGSRFDFVRIGKSINGYLVANKIVATPALIPTPLLERD